MMAWFHILSLLLLVLQCGAQDPIRPYPNVDSYLQVTSFLDHLSYVKTLDDPQWYLDNIPFIDVPEKSIQDVYYYRASVIKRHLKFAHEGHGWIFTEFIQPVTWASKFQTIPDSAAHQIVEARWLRNPMYTDDTIQLHTRGGVETLSNVTYTHYIHRAAYEQAQATGDSNFITSQLEGIINMYGLWKWVLDNSTGLYHRTPILDAQEFSLPGYTVGGPNGGPVEVWNSFDNNYTTIDVGPETYRPSHNSFMVAGAGAIASIAQLAGQTALAQEWKTNRDTLYMNMEKLLWNEDLKFWIDVIEGTNQQVLGRQLIGFYPWRFDLGTTEDMRKGLEASLNSDGFLTTFGPTTLEQSNPYYTSLKNQTYCCLWQGQSWPFSTCVYLGTLARIVRDNTSTLITPDFFYDAFVTYAKTNYLGDTPFTAEVHYPELDAWSGYSTNHSEHYLHSTYLDNFFTNLIGVIPTTDDVLPLYPLVPSNWTYFAVENMPYHGSLISIVWDESGSHYSFANNTKGLSVYSNGSLIHSQPTLAPVNITLPFNSTLAAATLSSQTRYQNILANPNAPWGFPNITATDYYSANGDLSPYEAFHLNDGLMWYDEIPSNFWTNNQSTTPTDTLNITFPRPRTFNSISLAVLSDIEQGGVIACPEAIRISDGNTGAVYASRNPWTACKPNALNTILFDAPSADPKNATTAATGASVTTDFIQVTLMNQIYYAVALSEVQIWVPENLGPRYEAEDGLAGTFLGGFVGKQSGLNNSVYGGGVLLQQGGWVEIGNVVAPVSTNSSGAGLGWNATSGSARSEGTYPLTVIGGGSGTLNVQLNFLPGSNQTVTFSGAMNSTGLTQTLDVRLLPGRNVVTLMQVAGEPWVDAIVVG